MINIFDTSEEGIAKVNEQIWRNSELVFADHQINKIEDGQIAGSVSSWRAYRVALRNWPANEKFPDVSFRPVRPS